MSDLILVLFAVLNTAGAFIGAASDKGVPSPEFWTDRPNWILAGLAATLALPLGQAGFVYMRDRFGRIDAARKTDIETFLTGALISIAEQGGADIVNTGVQVFRVRGFWWWKRHDRVARVRLGAIASSGVKWTKGKGAIGRCWELRQPQFIDLIEKLGPYANYSRAQWDAIPEADRYKLTFDDFQKQKNKYWIVAAVPIVNSDDEYVGCVSADTPPKAGAQRPDEAQVLKHLSIAAANVARVL